MNSTVEFPAGRTRLQKPQEIRRKVAVVEISMENFESTIHENGVVILDFWAEWCGPCKAYAPIFERVSDELPDVTFGKINTEVEFELSGMFGIRSIPTTVVFRDGIGIFMQPGALPEDALRDLVEKVQDLDMEEVRAEMESKSKEEN
jgi:thioredoxin 1